MPVLNMTGCVHLILLLVVLSLTGVILQLLVAPTGRWACAQQACSVIHPCRHVCSEKCGMVLGGW